MDDQGKRVEIAKTKCDRENCTNKAAYAVCLELRVHPHHEPSVAYMGLTVCEAHKDVQWWDLIDDQGWQRIQRTFKQSGKQAPDQRHSNVLIKPILGMD